MGLVSSSLPALMSQTCSFLLTQFSCCSVNRPAIRQQLRLAPKSQKDPFHLLLFISVSIYFPPPNVPHWCLMLFLDPPTTRPQDHTACVDLLAQHQPSSSLRGQWLFGGFVWWFCLDHLKAFETVENRGCLVLEAARIGIDRNPVI